MERIAMSQAERDELNWLKQAKEGRITQREAAERIGVSDRWVRKLLKGMAQRGDAVVVHGLRGRPSNRKFSEETRRQALAILKEPEWHDFGPTFASEQLAKRHKIKVSDETLRGWMIDAGIWKSKAQTRLEVHGWRPRRSGFGELVQWDTSDHDWMEGRGPVRYLVRMIDDATSWSWGRFVESDATPQNMGVLWEYLEKNGRMLDVYTDRHSMFTVAPRAGETEQQRREADRLRATWYPDFGQRSAPLLNRVGSPAASLESSLLTPPIRFFASNGFVRWGSRFAFSICSTMHIQFNPASRATGLPGSRPCRNRSSSFPSCSPGSPDPSGHSRPESGKPSISCACHIR